MRRPTRKACYELLAELLVYPDARDEARIERLAREADRAPADVRDPLRALLRSPEVRDCERYVALIELAPACPLYLGHYLFDEPRSCRGAATSGRNRYMIELAAIYRHFGLEPTGAELPDFLPLVLEFLSLSLDRPARNRGGLREVLVHRYVAPAVRRMRVRFAEAGGCWALALECLDALLRGEPEPGPGVRRGATGPGRGRRGLPVIQHEART